MLMKIPQPLIKAIKALDKPTIIGISGFGGSGKTTLAQLLQTEFELPIISIDSFNLGLRQFSDWNTFDFDRLTNDVIKPFFAKTNPLKFIHNDGEYPPQPKIIHHQGVIIIEGVGLFRPKINQYINLKLWVDCPLDTAIKRGKNRDRKIWHNPKDKLWDGLWKDNDRLHFKKYQPKKMADIIIKN